jgi:hypothetical protein
MKLTLQEATEALEETEPVVKKTTPKTSRKKKLELEEVPNVLDEEEGIDITKIKPKTKTTRKKKLDEFEVVGGGEEIDITKIKPKTTRKKKLGEFEIVGEEEIVDEEIPPRCCP